MAVAIDLDPHIEIGIVLLAKVDDGLRAGQAVGEDAQLAALAQQRQCLGQFAGSHGDGIKNVPDACCETMFRLLQGGHGNALGARVDLRPDRWQAFAGLDVWAQAHAQVVHALLHALDVALHARYIDQRGGRVEVGQRNCHPQDSLAWELRRLYSVSVNPWFNASLSIIKLN
jgi:hypothetical protein